MNHDHDPDRWARLRFWIIGPYWRRHPNKANCASGFRRWPGRWKHPVNGTMIRFSCALERWYYLAKVPGIRSWCCAAGAVTTPDGHAVCLPHSSRRSRRSTSSIGWTAQLHYDNLLALAQEDADLGEIPAYGTVRRYLKTRGYHRKRLPRRDTPGTRQAGPPGAARGAQL